MKQQSWRLAPLTGLPLLAANPVWASPSASSPTEQKKTQQLVRQLGSDVYQEREQASLHLEKMGLAAKTALEQGLNDPDLEIRNRCRELLPSILEMDLRNRIAVFLADKDGKADHDIPLWACYRKAIGEDAGARQLFAEMLKGETLAFLLDCAENPNRQSDNLDRYTRQMQIRAFQPVQGRAVGQYDRGDMAAVLLIAGEVKNPGQQTPFLVSNMLYQQSARNALNDAATGPALKKLLLRWMHAQTQENVILQLCNIVQNLNLKEGNDFLLNVIKEKKVRGVFLGQVIINLARTGNKDHIPVIEVLLTDETLLGKIQFNQVRGETQVRDVALGMLVHLTGQSHKDYDFSFLAQNPNLMWSAHYLGFSTPEQRTAAHKKWQEWASKNKKEPAAK